MPDYNPITRSGYTLGTLEQEILREVIDSGDGTTLQEMTALVRAQCKAPGIHAEVIALAFLTFLANRGILRRPDPSGRWATA